jgi:hypothetical protein
VLMLAIIFALIGAALGLRFRAHVLVPASCFALAIPVLTNFAYGYSLPVLALANDYDAHGASGWVYIG